MGNKLKDLEFKKLFQEYAFLSVDEEYKKEFILENNSVFISAIKKLISEEPELKNFINPQNNTDNVENNVGYESPTTFEQNEVKAYLDYPEEKFNILDWLLNRDKCKEPVIYSDKFNQNFINEEQRNSEKKEKTTKTIDENTLNKLKSLFRKIAKKTHPDKAGTNEFSDIYIKAKESYDKNDIYELYFICMKLGISYEVENLEKEEFKLKAKQKREEIIKLEASYVWLYFSNEDLEEKKQLIRVFLTQHGIRFKSALGL